MTTTPSRPEHVDQHGAIHRHDCPMPGYTIDPRTTCTVRIARCDGCGAVRLITKKETANA